MSCPYGTPAGHTVSQARQSRQSDRWSTVESVSPMRPSARDLMRKMRPRGESISVPSSEKVGHEARHRPQCTHELTPSTDRPCSASGGGGTTAGTWLTSDACHEAAGVEDVAGIQLLL